MAHGTPWGPAAAPQPDYTKPGWGVHYAKRGPYLTQLPLPEEVEFRRWAADPANGAKDYIYPSPTADYDMRGYWKAWKSGQVSRSLSQFDNLMHFPDTWKTPYHKSFSKESIYALPTAPHWVGDKLVDGSGRVIIDETPTKRTK